jgi:hypothetical protein
MVVAPALKRAAWIGGAGLAASVILVLTWYGRRPDPGLVRFEPAGVMLHLRIEDVREVQVLAGDQQQHFTRSYAGTWRTARAPVSAETAQYLERGLRFLHVTAPQRVLSPEEYAETSLAAFGLAPPRSVVVVRTATNTPFIIEFGDVNPQGLAQYARIIGRAEIILLPRFVGEPWEAVVP